MLVPYLLRDMWPIVVTRLILGNLCTILCATGFSRAVAEFRPMYLPYLYRAAWPMVVGGVAFLLASLILINIIIPWFELLRAHPGIQRLIGAAPLLHPLVCWVAFDVATRHDRRIEQELVSRAFLPRPR